MRIKSITHQTLALLVSLTIGLATVFFSLTLITAFVVEDSVLSNLLDEQATRIEQHYIHHGDLPSIDFTFLEVFTSIDQVPAWAKERIGREQLSGEIFTSNRTHYHYRKLALGEHQDGVLLAEVSNLLVVTHQPRIFGLFLLVFSLAIAFAVLLAVKFSQRIVKPILSLTNAVKSNEQLAANAPLPQLEFELGYLSTALQDSFNKLNLLLEREKAFATNVSHELRTPLTVLKNSCSLIEQRGFKTGDLSIIKASCEQMEHIVDVLLTLARAESLTLQPCNVRLYLEQAILRCHALPIEHFQIQLAVPHNLILLANPKLLELLFFNLLRNAAEHASEPILTIIEKNGDLIFENKAEIYLHVDITQVGIKSVYSNGLGQGLYLVARIVEQFGWQLNVESSDQRFSVVISPA